MKWVEGRVKKGKWEGKCGLDGKGRECGERIGVCGGEERVCMEYLGGMEKGKECMG